MTTALAPAGERTLASPISHLPTATRRILELGARACRWPLGDTGDEDFRFCASPREPRSSYCAEHGHLAHRAKP